MFSWKKHRASLFPQLTFRCANAMHPRNKHRDYLDYRDLAKQLGDVAWSTGSEMPSVTSNISNFSSCSCHLLSTFGNFWDGCDSRGLTNLGNGWGIAERSGSFGVQKWLPLLCRKSLLGIPFWYQQTRAFWVVAPSWQVGDSMVKPWGVGQDHGWQIRASQIQIIVIVLGIWSVDEGLSHTHGRLWEISMVPLHVWWWITCISPAMPMAQVRAVDFSMTECIISESLLTGLQHSLAVYLDRSK